MIAHRWYMMQKEEEATIIIIMNFHGYYIITQGGFVWSLFGCLRNRLHRSLGRTWEWHRLVTPVVLVAVAARMKTQTANKSLRKSSKRLWTSWCWSSLRAVLGSCYISEHMYPGPFGYYLPTVLHTLSCYLCLRSFQVCRVSLARREAQESLSKTTRKNGTLIWRLWTRFCTALCCTPGYLFSTSLLAEFWYGTITKCNVFLF